MARSLVHRTTARLSTISVLTLALSACGAPQTAFPTPQPTFTPRPSDTSIPVATPVPTTTPTAKPIPAATTTPTTEPTPPPTELVWFAPNFGSRDFLDLFTRPEAWPAARSKIDVFKFYTQSILDEHCLICGPNTFSALVGADAFQQLSDWGIGISVEVGAVKEWGCTGTDEFRAASQAVQDIQANGGTVSFLAMDEPYIGGELAADGNSCGFTMEQSAEVTSRFIQMVGAAYPNILVGDIEPYPHFSAAELEAWVGALEARGVSLAYFHLDVDWASARQQRLNVASDLQRLEQFFQDRQVPFGVILTSNLNWTPISDRAYYDGTMEWTHTVNAAIGKPDHVIFQSWLGPDGEHPHEIPINLPEDDLSIYSHTRLTLDGMAEFGP